MKRCYIAGAITGVKDYQRKFEEAAAKVTELGMQPVNPCWLQYKANATWEDYMKHAITHLLTCDVIYCLPCWKESRGATIEHNLAKDLGIEIIYAEAA